MKYRLLALAFAAAVILTGCGSSTPGAPGGTLDGRWSTACLRGMKRSLTLSNGTIEQTVETYGLGCATLYSVTKTSGTVSAGPDSLDVTLTSSQIMYQDAAAIADLNSAAFCGFTDWKVGTFREVTGASCDNGTIYAYRTSYSIDGADLFLAQPEIEWGRLPGPGQATELMDFAFTRDGNPPAQGTLSVAGPATIAAGDCVAYSVTRAGDAEVIADTDTNLWLPSLGVPIYTTPACALTDVVSPGNPFKIRAGQTTATFYVRIVAGISSRFPLSDVDFGFVLSPILNVAVTGAPPQGEIAIDGYTPLTTYPAGTCSPVVLRRTVTSAQLAETAIFRAAVTAPLFGDPACSSETDTVTFAAGQSTTAIYVKGPAGTQNLTLWDALGEYTPTLFSIQFQ